MTCILTTVSQQIVDAIEEHRSDGGFVCNDFICDWDFEGRTRDAELTDNRLHVRVVVPRKWEAARRHTRDSLEYIAAWDIDVRQKMGVVSQGSDFEIERDRLAQLAELVEQIHELMMDNGPADTPYNLQWIAEMDGSPKQSEVLVAYSVKMLRENRQFYGCCREVFQVTP